ncbi:MAG: Plug and carboxypeptidase regulatory-like domain-containing protein [Gemmatimonadaceae bacterium]|nr:Plug and carboxypeptidase regulatory-like domain-containing protein [Gemmatimonadaceae bacterium]
MHAQSPVVRPAGLGRLTGEVFDSLFTRAPLVDASLYVEGLDRVITTDARGRFSADSVPAGRYRMTFFHPSLDVAGLQAPTVTADVRADEATNVRLATPGYATVARAACGVPAASAPPGRVVFGAVKRAGDQSVVPGALVRATWVEVTIGASGAKPTRGGRETRASDGGGFVLCDVPGDVESRLLVDAGDGSIGVTTFWPGEPGASMLSVFVPPADSAGRRNRSIVLNAQGAPIANAIVAAGRDTSTRTDARGQFALQWTGHPANDLVIRALGMQALTLPADEFAAPPRAMAVTLDEAGRRLADVNVRAAGRSPQWFDEFESRRKAGFGSFVTRAEIDRRNPSQTWQMLFGVPGLQVDTQNGRPRALYPGSLSGCEPTYWVDGVLFPDVPGNPRPPGPLSLIPPTEVEAMEVYPRASGVPSEFRGTQSACGVIVIWTRKGGGRPAPR